MCDTCPEPIPPIEIPPPPICEGEECSEITAGNCVKYTGPNLTCIGILTGDTLNSVIQRIVERLCDCCDGNGPSAEDCIVSDWTPWSECSGGVQTRTRTVIREPNNDGDECPDLEEERPCCTPVNCVVSQWSSWSDCVSSTRTRTRTVITPASCGGTACPVLIETEPCSTPPACDQPLNLTAEVQ